MVNQLMQSSTAENNMFLKIEKVRPKLMTYNLVYERNILVLWVATWSCEHTRTAWPDAA